MKLPRFKLKPASKSSTAAHILLNIFLAVMLLVFIREPISLPLLSVALLLLSKWRMIAVKPRFWFANIRANLVDIIIGLSVIVFMAGTNQLTTQLLWLAGYVVWLLIIKPSSTQPIVAIQALLGQTLGLIALHNQYSTASLVVLVLATWLVALAAARHFFSAFEEPNSRLFAQVWGLFCAQLAWLLGHWQLTYAFIPQISLVITIIGYSLAFCYYLHATRGLKSAVRNQFIIITVVSLLLIMLFSEWQYQGI